MKTAKEVQHTPTPWTQQIVNPKYHVGISAKDGSLIALVVDTANFPKDDANAQFICRAVNSHEALLEALKDAQAVINRLADEGRHFDDINRTMGLQGKINDAIAKAGGRV